MFNVLENLLSLHWVFHLRKEFLINYLFVYIVNKKNAMLL